ncbi:MAG TPA: hypothetical protein VEB68_03415 [Croceibacterium sp.]|nr:hypothetical protein [Croceibacterium sp.]
MRKKPDKRVIDERVADNQKRRLLLEMPARTLREQLADRITYEGSGAHKADPYSWGIEPYRGRRRDRTYCDLHARFKFKDRLRIQRLLRRGVIGGLISDHALKGDPSMLWTIDDNGWIYELRITNPGHAIYHGYPVLPSDPLARKIIARLSAWASDEAEERVEDTEILEAALLAAERRYV